MLRLMCGRLTYANVVASLALFVALGGVSYAALTLPANSVGGKQIRKNAVTGPKVKNSSLSGADIKNSSITGSDVKDKSLSAADFNGSVQGAQGPPGSPGGKGDPGTNGAQGAQGVPGPVTGELPSGTTLRGTYAIGAPFGTQSGYAGRTGVSFGLRLPSEPAAHIVAPGGLKPSQCQGTIYMPEAAPGHLCVFQHTHTGFDTLQVCRIAAADDQDGSTGACTGANRMGVVIEAAANGTTTHYGDGSWAVTAP